MYEIVVFPYTGFCPYNDSERTVDIEYFEIPMSMSTKPGYKRKRILCSDSANCSYFDCKSGCPLYREAHHNG